MLVSIPPSNDPNLELPSPPDGLDAWPYAVLDAGGTIHLADSATDLVAYGIPGYTEISTDDHEAALYARHDSLVEFAEVLQDYYRSTAAETGRWDPSSSTEDELTALYQPRTSPFGARSWDGEVPLVLFSTDYEPFTSRPAPDGRIVWLDPSTELTYLRSLHEIGVIDLHLHVGDAEVAA